MPVFHSLPALPYRRTAAAVWVYCEDKALCGVHHEECWLKHLAHPHGTAPAKTGPDVGWTTGILSKEEAGADAGGDAVVSNVSAVVGVGVRRGTGEAAVVCLPPRTCPPPLEVMLSSRQPSRPLPRYLPPPSLPHSPPHPHHPCCPLARLHSPPHTHTHPRADDNAAVVQETSEQRRYHVVVTAAGSATHWQSRVHYYWFKKIKKQCEAAGQCNMGGFTRLLHTGQADDLMNEIPTFVAQPLPAEHPDHGWVVCARRGVWVGECGTDWCGWGRGGLGSWQSLCGGIGRKWRARLQPLPATSIAFTPYRPPNSPPSSPPPPPPPPRRYIVLNRPYALMQWVTKATIPEKYVLMSEPDHVWLKPMPNLMKGSRPGGGKSGAGGVGCGTGWCVCVWWWVGVGGQRFGRLRG